MFAGLLRTVPLCLTSCQMKDTTVDWQKDPQIYARWLRLRLAQHDISRQRLLGTVMLLERTVHDAQQQLLQERLPMPFYALHDNNGRETRAWRYVAELTLYLKENGIDPIEWVKAACSWEPIRRQLMAGTQVALNWFAPTRRISDERLIAMESHFIEWKRYDA